MAASFVSLWTQTLASGSFLFAFGLCTDFGGHMQMGNFHWRYTGYWSDHVRGERAKQPLISIPERLMQSAHLRKFRFGDGKAGAERERERESCAL